MGVSVQESGGSVGRECVWGDYLCGRCGESVSECRRCVSVGAVSGISERVWGEYERGVTEVGEVNGRGGRMEGCACICPVCEQASGRLSLIAV